MRSQWDGFDEPYAVDPARAFASYRTKKTAFWGDDFFGDAVDANHWTAVDVGSATITQVDGLLGGGGIMRSYVEGTSEAQDASLYGTDINQFDINARLLVEFRARTPVINTGPESALGVCGTWNLDMDTIAVSAWFKWAGSAVVVAETDDTTNNNDDKATGITTTTTAWHIYQIDFEDPSDVKFYIDGIRVASATTFDMSNLTATEAVVQPCIINNKATGTSVHTLDVDYIKMWQDRQTA